MASRFAEDLVTFVKQRSHDDDIKTYCRDLLMELLAIDNTPNPDPAEMAANEERIFAIIERELRDLCGDAVFIERVPIDPAIADDENYSHPYYTITADRPEPLPVDQAYANRSNLIAILKADEPDEQGEPSIHNCHIDTVAGWIDPRIDGDVVYGRGACDDKGQVALLLAQIKILNEARETFGLSFARDRVYQFVIDEESGGNGALSMVRDQRFASHHVVIYEITSNIPHPANRGAMWYKCTLTGAGEPKVLPVELWPFVIRALEDEGAKIKAESNHPLFRPDHVQTSHGIFGPYGDHPSAVNDHVAVLIKANPGIDADQLALRLTDIIDQAVGEYTETYGDKSNETDPATGEPKVPEHFRLSRDPADDATGFRLDIYGKAGHMGAIAQCDCAITKGAFVLTKLIRQTKDDPDVVSVGALADGPDWQDPLVLEGGQGFQPTHRMADLKDRLTRAAEQGTKDYCKFVQADVRPEMVRLSFEKLHNEAYASDPNCQAMQAFEAAFKAVGETWPEPAAWQVSCDGRLYSLAGHQVVVFGPGELQHAHSANECMDLRQVQQGLALSVLQAARLGGMA